MTALPVTAIDALKFMATLTFRPFNDSDWSGWAGCESAEPMIAETDEITVIIDGDTVTFNQYQPDNGEAEWTLFTLRFDECC